jgi:hypothetical protein
MKDLTRLIPLGNKTLLERLTKTHEQDGARILKFPDIAAFRQFSPLSLSNHHNTIAGRLRAVKSESN